MSSKKKIAFLFPGQGAQYPGMAKDFIENFAEARHLFEEADDILQRKLSTLIKEGPEATLTQTKNSQVAIFVTSAALLKVVHTLFPTLKPHMCAGLSLGEYTALLAGGYLSFQQALPLVQFRGDCMNEACERTAGTMAVVLGLEAAAVEKVVEECQLPNDLWAANFNCPGQVVISGTARGIDAATPLLLQRGAKRVMSLQVHGAFHSGLMRLAEEKLEKPISELSLAKGESVLVMNVPGAPVTDLAQIRRYLIQQVTRPVRWEQGIRSMENDEIETYVEFGPGKTLSPMNKRIGVKCPTVSIEKIQDLDQLGVL